MSKKFDVVIGNPPYQEDPSGASTEMPPVYHLFADAAYEVGKQVVLITPARFLSDAGRTPKHWNRKMLQDPHLRVALSEPKSETIFPGTDIKGGIAVTHRDANRSLGPIDTFTPYPALSQVLDKVQATGAESIMDVTINRSSHTYDRLLFTENPESADKIGHSNLSQILSNAFSTLPDLFLTENPDDGKNYVAVLGMSNRERVYRWIRADYLSLHPSARNWKVAIAEANGSGQLGETLSEPIILGPGTIVTNTFITIGELETEAQAEALLKYIKTKFARAMLGILKVTHHTARRTWKHVPLQDFTEDSDIDWTKPIPEIDQQLYAKYGLNDEEIEFIESHVEPME